MRQSINKKKIYFYLLILIFLSTIFNFNIVYKVKNLSLINNIDIVGLGQKEEYYLINELKTLIDKNIFSINKNKIQKKLELFSFLDSYFIKKILPSKILVLAKKTKFIGMTIIEGDKFYLGLNGKLTLASKVEREENLPMIFGKFSTIEFLKLRDDLKKQKFDLNQIKEYFYHQSKRWDLKKKDGTLIMLPSKKIQFSLSTYKNLINKNEFSSAQVIDLRIPKTIIVTND
tara:strand:- start:1887 stop:2576 length:690 start_codon:yes stop_codon:yes gene_type:complete